MKPNQWYKLEIEVKANTPGVRDGEVRVWVDGNLVLNRTNMNLRGTLSTGITKFQVGRQADRLKNIPVDEYRYWDDIVISGQRDKAPPAPPVGLRIQ